MSYAASLLRCHSAIRPVAAIWTVGPVVDGLRAQRPVPVRIEVGAQPLVRESVEARPRRYPTFKFGGCRLMETIAFENVRAANRPLEKIRAYER